MNFINNNKRSLQVDYEQHQFKRYKTPNSLSKDAFHSDLGLHLKHANDIILQLQSKLSLEKVRFQQVNQLYSTVYSTLNIANTTICNLQNQLHFANTQTRKLTHSAKAWKHYARDQATLLRLSREKPIYAIRHNAMCQELLATTTKIYSIEPPTPTITYPITQTDDFVYPLKKFSRDRKLTRREIQEKNYWTNKKMLPPSAFLAKFILKTDPRAGLNRRHKRSGKHPNNYM